MIAKTYAAIIIYHHHHDDLRSQPWNADSYDAKTYAAISFLITIIMISVLIQVWNADFYDR